MDENILDISNQPPKARPIGGWLYLFYFILPLSILKYFYALFNRYNFYFEEGPDSYFHLYLVLYCGSLFWACFSFYLFTKKRNNFIPIYLFYLIFTTFFKPFIKIATLGLYRATYVYSIFSYKNNFWYEVVFVLAIATYLKFSERASQTFVN